MTTKFTSLLLAALGVATLLTTAGCAEGPYDRPYVRAQPYPGYYTYSSPSWYYYHRPHYYYGHPGYRHYGYRHY